MEKPPRSLVSMKCALVAPMMLDLVWSSGNPQETKTDLFSESGGSMDPTRGFDHATIQCR